MSLFGKAVSSERRVLTVQELTLHIKGLLERDDLLSSVRVRGEISNFRKPSSGHMYFTLKDENSQIRCVMFRGQNFKVRFEPHDGLSVDVTGYVSIYDRDGQCQLYAQEMSPAGVGDLYLAFEQLKSELQQEGLFDQGLKRKPPLLPKRVAIITSPTGAAVRDVLTVANRRCPRLNVVVVPAQMQGQGSGAQIAKALGRVSEIPDIDVVILTRGGGSLEELWAFNEAQVARAIRSCVHPVVVGVGHEVDITIADLAADLRAPTPSAAAEMVFPDCAALGGHLSALAFRLRSGLRQQAQRLRRRLDRTITSQVLRRPQQVLAHRSQRLDTAVHALGRTTIHGAERRRLHLGRLGGQLDAMSPLAVLSRGYAICTEAVTGKIVRSATIVSPGSRLLVKLAQGVLGCLVETAVPQDDPSGGSN